MILVYDSIVMPNGRQETQERREMSARVIPAGKFVFMAYERNVRRISEQDFYNWDRKFNRTGKISG